MTEIRTFEAFAGYGSQLMALKRIAETHHGIKITPVGISEIDRHAISAYNAVHGDVTNYGDISKIDWSTVPDFDLFTYSSPCFVAGTLVLTKRGYIPIEKIIVGDYVLTHTNNWRKVVRTGSKIANQMVELKGMPFDNIKCTINHPFYTRNKYRYGHFSKRMFEDPKWTEAGLLDKDKYLGYSIVQNEYIPLWNGVKDNRWGHGRISNRISPLLAESSFWYIMGRYVGDGWTRTSNNGSSVVICCGGRNEQQLVDAFDDIGFHYKKTKERTVNKYRICSNELFEFVKRYGAGAANKRIDIDTMMLPKNLLKSFLRGYLHSDGYFDSRTKEYKFSSVSRELVYGVQMCIAKVFNRPTALYFTKRKRQTTIEGRLVNQKDSYEVKFHKEHRKQDHSFNEKETNWFPLSKIEKYTENNIVYNLEVDIDNSYTANGVIVHNCQDFSTAGRQSGGEEGSGTRSSLLWECRRAILAKKPKYLLFENVKALTSRKFIGLFNKWQAELESYGYTNYAKVLNAKDFDVPQNRERVFMVSILGDHEPYSFPQPVKPAKRLRDILEPHADERYYLSQERVRGLLESTRKEREAGRGYAFKPKTPKDTTANAVTTTPGGRKTDNFISEDQTVLGWSRSDWKNIKRFPVEVSNCITAGKRDNTQNYVVEPVIAAVRGRSDGKWHESQHRQRLEIRGNISNTISTVDKDNVVVEQRLLNGTADGNATTTTTAHHYAGNITDPKRGRKEMGVPETSERQVRIRKLTERECFRLMDVSEQDIDKIQNAGISSTQQYKMAGNSIVVACLQHVLENLLYPQGHTASAQTSLF